MMKKKMPRFRVSFCSTLVVCAPKRFSVIPPPNAAPKPSFFGRCISTSRMISTETMTTRTRRILMRICMSQQGGRKGRDSRRMAARCKEEVCIGGNPSPLARLSR